MEENYCIKFLKRLGANELPEQDNFRCEGCKYPDIGYNEIVIKTLYLSVDPVQTRQMHEDSGLNFLQPFQPNEVITGLCGVGLVVESQNGEFKPGDIVVNWELKSWPWQLYFKTSNADMSFAKVDYKEEPKLFVTYYGIPGLTALTGLQEKGGPLNGKSLVVSGAAGSVGHLVGQFALIEGCNPVVGICGNDKKCELLEKTLKFTGAINYNHEDFEEKLQNLCSTGIDIYFDNVGGKISDAVIKLMNKNGRIIVCGQISSIKDNVSYPSQPMIDLIMKMKIERQWFAVISYSNTFKARREYLHKLKQQYGVQVLDTILEGLENVPSAFCGMLRGFNIGKQLVKVSNI